MINVDVANEAVALVTGDRSEAYDVDGSTSFRVVSRLWSAYLDHGLTETDVCNMMALLKIGRSLSGYKADTYVDAVGYVLLAEAAHRSQNGSR